VPFAWYWPQVDAGPVRLMAAPTFTGAAAGDVAGIASSAAARSPVMVFEIEPFIVLSSP